MKRRLLIGISVVVLLLVLDSVLALGRMVHRGLSTRDKPGTVEALLATSMRDKAIPSRYKRMKNPVAVTPEVLHEAMVHWADHCATCHANNGTGETMFGRTMYPRPPDMRKEGTQEMSDGELYYTIKNGVRLSGMPAFGEPGDDDLDSWKLVGFIRHLPSLSADEELEMGALNPKKPEERQEEQQEEDFLRGSRPSPQPQFHQ